MPLLLLNEKAVSRGFTIKGKQWKHLSYVTFRDSSPERQRIEISRVWIQSEWLSDSKCLCSISQNSSHVYGNLTKWNCSRSLQPTLFYWQPQEGSIDLYKCLRRNPVFVLTERMLYSKPCDRWSSQFVYVFVCAWHVSCMHVCMFQNLFVPFGSVAGILVFFSIFKHKQTHSTTWSSWETVL